LSFLILGDLHIGVQPKGLPVSNSYVLQIVDQVEQYARMNGIHEIAQLGDLHDSVHVPEEQRIFVMEMLSKSKLTWHIQFGNHDYRDIEYNTLMFYKDMQEKFSLLKNVKFYTEPTITKVADTNVAFLPWPHTKIKSEKPLICFGHFALAGAKGDTGYVLKGDNKLSGKHFWFIGDLHTFQEGEDYCYIGAPLQFKYGDTPDRFFAHFIGNERKPKYKTIPLQLPYILDVNTVKSVSKIDKLLNSLKTRTDYIFTKVKYSPEVFADYRYAEISKLPRVIVEPLSGKHKENEETEAVVLIDSKHLRRSLVRKRLEKKGFGKTELKLADNILDELEEK